MAKQPHHAPGYCFRQQLSLELESVVGSYRCLIKLILDNSGFELLASGPLVQVATAMS